MIIQLFVTVSIHVAAFCRAEDTYCYAEDPHPYINLGTRTAYESIYNKGGISPQQGCHPLQVWMLCRHGTRIFLNKDVPAFLNLTGLRDKIVSNYGANQSRLCTRDMNNFKNFSFDIPLSNVGLLSEQGYQDMIGLGRRMAAYFPQLFNSPYSPDKYVIWHKSIPRINQSAVYFAKGLFGLSFNTSLPDTNSTITNLIDPSNKCQAWSDTLPEADRIVDIFEESEIMSSLIARVSSRLGFENNLTSNDVMAMYLGCEYYKAWNLTETSAWCAAFTKLDLEVIEYMQDLSNFPKDGPGNPFSNRLACPLLKDLLHRFRAVSTYPEATHPSALLYFSSDIHVGMFSTLLGLSQDSLPLTADNMLFQLNRKFRSSTLMPFAANIIAVLYNCSEGGLKVGFYQHERPFEVPGCGGPLCDLERLDQLFGSLTDNPACTDRSFCAAASGTSLALSIWVAAFIASFSLLVSFLRARIETFSELKVKI